jgi:hypothetical protein
MNLPPLGGERALSMAKSNASVGTNDPVFLAAALEGLKLQRARIDDQIRQVEGLLGKRRPGRPVAAEAAAPEAAAAPRRKRKLSAAARARIAAAQKKRWAEYRKQKES